MPSRLLSVWSCRSLLRGFKLTRYRDQRGSDDFRGDALNSESRNKAGDGSSRYAFLLLALDVRDGDGASGHVRSRDC